MERKSDEARPADLEAEDAKPPDEGPDDSDLRPEADTEHVVEKKGEEADPSSGAR